jgi:hypothetical protein
MFVTGVNARASGNAPDRQGVGALDADSVRGTSARLLGQTIPKENIEMPDQDLRGDDLKLVRWAVSFTKRDVELALDGGIELIDYSTEVGDFKGSKKDDFLRKLRKKHMPLPDKWRNEGYPPKPYISGDEVTDLPPSDADKFLRVFVEVLDRYEKAEADYEKEGSKALKGIRKTLENWPHKP